MLATTIHTWSPQDLTKDVDGFQPIPDNDYVKQYERNPELWPVEFFLIAYRRTQSGTTTQVLVRESANGTSKWGVGTGVPATRWMLSSAQQPPRGYQWSEPTFDASNYPEFPTTTKGQESWTYRKIDIQENAFHDPNAPEVQDPELSAYATKIWNGLTTKLAKQLEDEEGDSWEKSRNLVVQSVLEKDNCLAAIHGTLRMSGLFSHKDDKDENNPHRYVSFDDSMADPIKLVESMRIYTMFPQMPDPMPLPGTSAEELQQEIETRDARMAETGRNPHKDHHGRIYTHKSTSNVSNTIIGVYLTLDATDIPGLEDVPAVDLFGSRKIQRQWISLQDLKVLDEENKISTDDTKPTFISGFIVRQLVKEGVIV
ncbi:expressed unknown protein [Seminavis robusta]|uniref:Uncharacterized protein n=1 Tax=Seminavis robusta TaxID=568900 RepID=A0A9N8DTB5_9STRA|nr:expressed unknown protein [Seminavis robusta]|eukprot:Sro265_g102950.1 n/a (370) ;mRNA; r:77290-78399